MLFNLMAVAETGNKKNNKTRHILHAVTTSVFYRHILADSGVDKTVA